MSRSSTTAACALPGAELDLAQQRAEIEAVLARHWPNERPAILTGWVVVAEFTEDDGERVLTRVQAEGITSWARQGLLYNALQEDHWIAEDDET